MPHKTDNIGPFQIVDKLGQGAMAVVWRAYDPSLDREVAIKEPLIPEDSSTEVREEFSARFVREAKAAGGLNHPGIVTIYSASVYEGRPAIVMELVNGVTLREMLKAGPLSTRRTFALMDQLMQAVAYAHQRGVTHRDLKPDNVFIAHDGAVKLADFGIAQIGPKGTMNMYGSGSGPALTRVGTMIGTPAYMAPEQVKGERVDARCDVFALGVLAYECLAGANPFGSETSTHFATILHRIMSEPTPPLHVDDELAGPLSSVIMTALEKERDDRFTDAGVMLTAWRDAFSSSLDVRTELAGIAGVTAAMISGAPPVPEKTRQWGLATAPVGLADEISPADAVEEPITVVPDEEVEAPHPQPEPVDGRTRKRSRRPLVLVVGVAAVLLVGFVVARGLGGSAQKSAGTPVAPETTVSVEATMPAKQTSKPAAKPKPQPLAVTLSATTSDDDVGEGDSFSLRVVAAAGGAIANGTRVVLERKYADGDWKAITSTWLSAGRSSVKMKISKDARFRFVLTSSAKLQAATSNVVKVSFHAPAVVTPAKPKPGGVTFP